MYDAIIVDLLDQCIDLDEDLPALIESQLKCLAGLPAETPLVLTE
jgi:hypothetical protein